MIYCILPTEKQILAPCESHIERLLYDKLKERSPELNVLPQAKIGKYRVDFLLPEHKIVIECDGKDYHRDKVKDWRRQREIEGLGFRAIRASGEKIYKEIVGGNTSNNTGGYDIIDVVLFYCNERNKQ